MFCIISRVEADFYQCISSQMSVTCNEQYRSSEPYSGNGVFLYSPEWILSDGRYEYSYGRSELRRYVQYAQLAPFTTAQTVRGRPTPKDDNECAFRKHCSANSYQMSNVAIKFL